MSMINCIDSAVKQGTLTLEEGDSLKKRYEAIAARVFSTGEAKEQLLKEVAVEAAERKRRALLTETIRTRLFEEMQGYTNLKGEHDLAEAFVMMHENFGRMGSYIKDAETSRLAIRNGALEDMAQIMKEFRRGVITGDLRRSKKAVSARMENVVRELFGENTGDDMAKAMAGAWAKVSEDLRLRFNEAGGAVQKLDKWGLPQSHDAQALLDYGRDPWIKYMMQDGVLDRDRTVHPLSRRPMSDAELKESLGVVWDRITTDGFVDREITGVPVGRGALWTQHADHRFLHFKGADAWMSYAKDFGQMDHYAAMVGHVNRMSRDIAHMETFGPNPNVMRQYLKSLLESKAASIKSTDVVIKEQAAEAKRLMAQLSKPNPEYVKLLDDLERVTLDMHRVRGDIRGGITGMKFPPGRTMNKAERAQMAVLSAEFDRIHKELNPYKVGDKPRTLEDHDTLAQVSEILDNMRDPVMFADRKNPRDYLSGAIDRADAMWELQRGSLAPVRVGVANTMASIRNLISSASLGAAWLSSLNDPAFGQDARLRFGLGMAQSSFARLYPLVLKEMVPILSSREEAVRARLGMDSAIEVMHRTARENKSWDARAWTGFVADRVLTIGLLSPWTQAGKHIFGLDLQAFMADMSKNRFDELPMMTQRALKSHGFDAGSWEKIRASELHQPEPGAFYLRPAEVEAAAGRELSERYIAMILRETRFAIPESTVASRSVLGRTRPGTTLGEVMRSAGQFKGFGIAVAMLHMGRVAREIGAGDGNPIRYAGALLITSTFLGAISMALKDIKDGRDPRKMLDENTYLDPAFWGAAALQAGGLGIYGDFLFSNVARTGGGLQSVMAGPMVDRLDNLRELTVGNAAQLMQGKKTHFGRELTRAVRTNVPGQNLLWTSLVWNRVIMDQLQKYVDPEAYTSHQQQMRKRKTDFKQDYWWNVGATSPHRTPDVSRMWATK